MKIRGQKKTDIGNVHKVNDDSCTLRWYRTMDGCNTPVVMTAVADGMGGMERGDYASSLAVSMCEEWFRTEVPVLVSGTDRDAEIIRSMDMLICRINRAIKDGSAREGFNTGTTLCLLLIFEWRYYAASIGDSRIYQITRESGLMQITDDDSWVQREIDSMPADVREDPARKREFIDSLMKDRRRSMLTQCLGLSDNIGPHFYQNMIDGTCWFLLCSDGFRNLMPERGFLDIMDEDEYMGLDCDAILDGRIRFIKERGEPDNITAVLVKVYDDFTEKMAGGDE